MDSITEEPPVKPRYRKAKNYPRCAYIRLTPAEHELFCREAKESGLSLSRFVAYTFTRKRYPPTLADREGLFRTRFLLEKAGTNLNQIAHRLNAAALGAPVEPPTHDEIRQVMRTVKAIALEIKRRVS